MSAKSPNSSKNSQAVNPNAAAWRQLTNTSNSDPGIPQKIPDNNPNQNTPLKNSDNNSDKGVPLKTPDNSHLNSKDIDQPLIAVNLHLGADAERRAREIAERRLNEDLRTGNAFNRLVKSIWQGNLMRRYYIRKNYDTAYQQIKDKTAGFEVNELSDKDWKSDNEFTIKRVVNASVDGYEDLLHTAAGEQQYQTNQEATDLAKKIISDYAEGKISDINQFNEKMQPVRDMLRSDTKHTREKDVVQDNYWEIAKAVKGRFQNQESLDRILKGFQIINADVRTGVRTEAHRTALDKVVDKIEDFKSRTPLLNLIPSTFIAGAASVALSVGKYQANAMARATTFGLGGSLVSGAMAAVKEGNRVAIDRAQRQAEAAMGIQGGEAKYDKSIGETLYAMQSATSLTEKIAKATKSEKPQEIQKALADVESLIKYSDQNKKDHISYSSPKKIEEERWALDLAIAEAKSKFTAKEREDYKALLTSSIKSRSESLGQENQAKDQVFQKLRHKRMAAMGLKTAAVAAGTVFASQEVIAATSKDFYGIFDKAFKLENNPTAENTMLANLLGFKNPSTPQLVDVLSQPKFLGSKELTPEEVEHYQNQEGTTLLPRTESFSKEEIISKDVNEASAQFGSRIKRVDTGSYGTVQFDKNELGQSLNPEGDGFFTHYKFDTITEGGKTIDVKQAMTEGKVKLFISANQGTQSTPFEVTGTLMENGQISFTPEPGSTAAQFFQDGNFVGKYAEICYVADTVDGVQQVIPLSTVVGNGVEGAINVVEQVPYTKTVYDIVTASPLSESLNTVADGIVIAPPIGLAGRQNLTYANSTPVETIPTETTPPPAGQASTLTASQSANQEPIPANPPIGSKVGLVASEPSPSPSFGSSAPSSQPNISDQGIPAKQSVLSTGIPRSSQPKASGDGIPQKPSASKPNQAPSQANAADQGTPLKTPDNNPDQGTPLKYTYEDILSNPSIINELIEIYHSEDQELDLRLSEIHNIPEKEKRTQAISKLSRKERLRYKVLFKD